MGTEIQEWIDRCNYGVNSGMTTCDDDVAYLQGKYDKAAPLYDRHRAVVDPLFTAIGVWQRFVDDKDPPLLALVMAHCGRPQGEYPVFPSLPGADDETVYEVNELLDHIVKISAVINAMSHTC